MAAPLLSLMLMAVLVLVCGGSPLSHSPRGAEEQAGRRGPHPGTALSLQPELQAERTERLAEDQREIITKQILQALIIPRECISDYQGWVDFGRRSTD
uniref:Gastrin/cholecystokinin peptide hormone domain-containing protein n=1 Tax=Astyanax mexicanus TaxID=7994 RepID=A0A3B1K8F2_ASTMX